MAATPAFSTGPRSAYTERAAGHRRLETRALRREQILRTIEKRIFVFAAAAIFILVEKDPSVVYWCTGLACFYLVVARWHRSTVQECRQAARAAEYCELGLARLDGTWPGRGSNGSRFIGPEHTYALDLDLFGVGSLFELLSTTRTCAGEDTLAAWLTAPASPAEVEARQGAVQGLRGGLDLREGVALLPADAVGPIETDSLAVWAKDRSLPASWFIPLTCVFLGLLLAASLAGWLLQRLGFGWFLMSCCLQACFAWWHRCRVNAVLGPVEHRRRDLELLGTVLDLVECGRFTSSWLQARQRSLRQIGSLGRHIRSLAPMIGGLQAGWNSSLAPLPSLFLWRTFLGFAIERWRRLHGERLTAALPILGEFEAMLTLAAYAFENPEDVMPEFVGERALFAAEGLGHPLRPATEFVRNDLFLDSERSLLIVSGSNMSGKSTLLRTVGLNVVLASSGAPVRARRLRLAPFVLGATLRIQDSLRDGRSRFFAEITRLRRLVDIAQGPQTLLFLLDELLAGTNSQDRRAGAEALLRALLAAGAIGLVTTHDLALTDFAEAVAPRATNSHFEDHLDNGVLRFDYCLRPGIVRTSNALALMRAVGLEV